ncbi:MAG: hypothetical protein ABIP03_02915 [Aquihabitans sp.]
MPDGDGSRVWVQGPYIRFDVGDDGTIDVAWRRGGFLGHRLERNLASSEISVQRARVGRGPTRGLRLDTPAGEVFYLWCPDRVQEQIGASLVSAGAEALEGEFTHDWLRIGLDDYRSRRADRPGS